MAPAYSPTNSPFTSERRGSMRSSRSRRATGLAIGWRSVGAFPALASCRVVAAVVGSVDGARSSTGATAESAL